MKIVNKLNSNYKDNKLLYLTVFIFFCVGIALGTYMVKYMNANDANDLSNYFSTFTKNIIGEPINKKALLINILKKNLVMLTIIILFGLTVFGTPAILLIDLLKGFSLGYSFSFLLTTFDGKGIWLAIASTVPQNLIYIPCFIALSIISIEFSSTKLRDKFFNKGKVNTIIEKEIIYKIGVFLCIFLIGTIVETFLCPNLIKVIITNVYKIG